MKISYFDSSFLITILMNEPKTQEALYIWKNSKVRISSILLKFESNIVLRRNYENMRNKIGNNWLKGRLFDLKKYLDDVFCIDINEKFENSICSDYDILSKCKSLDAIHIATALDISEKYGRSEICICSFDKNMLKIAKELGFETV
ncbi:hypothetical protein R83H12_02345 [Fibrobacteria bacterium R8-3-H12]